MNSNDSIENRQAAERAFHDSKFSKTGAKSYYALGFTSLVFETMMKHMGDIEDKNVLEFGCGSGWFTKMLVDKKAAVWAFDISEEAVKRTKAGIASLDSKYMANVDQMGAEQLSYDSNKFDIVVGNAILHHVDLPTAIREIKRVLKPGGKAYFMEPLGHNPILNAYRALTPHKRSRDETPLRSEHLALFQDAFRSFHHEEFYLTALLALCWYPFGMNGMMLKTRDVLARLDRRLLHIYPGLSKYYWYTLLIMGK